MIESAFRRTGGIGALAATATLAQGINLPAYVAILVGDERFDAESEGFAPLDPHELLNAAGRAGRAGLVAQPNHTQISTKRAGLPLAFCCS